MIGYHVQLTTKLIPRLKRVLEAAATTPGNRDRFFDSDLLDSNNSQGVQLSNNWYQSFGNLRAIDKQTIRENPGLFLASVDDVVYRGATSGSRGKSFVYFAGTEWNKARIQARRHSLQWWGIDEETPIINVASRLLPVRNIDLAIAGSPNQELANLLHQVLEKRPAVIRGYPSRLCDIATYFKGNIPSIIAVICTGECLFDYQRHVLQKVFQAPIIEEYGCQETGISGLTCPEAGRLHLDTERCLYEIIDRQLVTTDLFNFVMPLVRYKCGDILDLNLQTCPCGRPGLTAKVLGRIEDKIRTLNGIKHPGEITMPPLEGILNYHVARREGTQIDLWLQPQANELSLEPLVAWVEQIFGEVSAEIFLDDTEEISQIAAPICTDDAWIRSVTKGSWLEWVNEPKLPQGEARQTAQLLHQLVAPAVITNSGLFGTTKELFYDILDRPPCKNPEVERMTARVLLFGCNFLANDPQVVSIYQKVAERLHRVMEGRNQEAIIDLLIPTLFLDTKIAQSIWADFPKLKQCSLDRFNVHHLLYAFEPAVRRANASGSTVVQALKPILSVLIGDLNFFAERFGVWLIAHWFELIHQQTVADFPMPNEQFLKDWLMLRQQLVKGENCDVSLSKLTKTAQSAAEKSRVYLEKGYSLLTTGQPLDPDYWLKIIEENVEIISESEDADLIPWLPIVRSLTLPLLENHEPALAYHCLVASTISSSRTSAFERIALQVNDKQSVICDFLM